MRARFVHVMNVSNNDAQLFQELKKIKKVGSLLPFLVSWYYISVKATWWRHQTETFSALLAICAGNSPVPDEFPAQRPVTWSFDVFFDLHLNKWLSKQSCGWWFEMPWGPLWLMLMSKAHLWCFFETQWRPCDVTVMSSVSKVSSGTELTLIRCMINTNWMINASY